MALARRLYRNCKVWADVDDAGKLVEQRGLVKIRYRQDSPETYSAKVAEISEVPDPGPTVATPDASAAAPSDAVAPKRRPARTPKNRSKSSARGGTKAAGAAGPAKAKGDVVTIYADGSCFGNPGPAGIGVTLEWKGHVKEISRFIGDGTNNIAELTAIRVALEEVKNRGLPVRVHTDSAYSIGVLSEGWKVKENRELVASIQALMREFGDLQFVKVRGHSGHPENERVDQLARDAITRRA
jgi:ribonuclease HI